MNHGDWRAVDQQGDVIDVLVQRCRHQQVAKRFYRRLLKGHGGEPRRLVTDKLRSYNATNQTGMPTDTSTMLMLTTALKYRTNPLANENTMCEGLPHRLKLNAFSHSTG